MVQTLWQSNLALHWKSLHYRWLLYHENPWKTVHLVRGFPSHGWWILRSASRCWRVTSTAPCRSACLLIIHFPLTIRPDDWNGKVGNFPAKLVCPLKSPEGNRLVWKPLFFYVGRLEMGMGHDGSTVDPWNLGVLSLWIAGWPPWMDRFSGWEGLEKTWKTSKRMERIGKKPRSLTLYAVGEKISWDASNMFQPIWGWLEEDWFYKQKPPCSMNL